MQVALLEDATEIVSGEGCLGQQGLAERRTEALATRRGVGGGG